MNRTVIAILSSLVLSATPVIAAAPTQQPTLAPGGAAGVEQAAFLGRHALLVLLGLGVVAGGVWLTLGNNGSSSVATTTTSAP